MIDRPSVVDVLPLVRAFYALPGNAMGGALHIVLDDGNVKDSHVHYCLEEATARRDVPATRLAELLSRMTTTQRKHLYRSRKSS